MLSVKLLSNVEFFLCFLVFLVLPPFLSALQGLHCLLAFENELLYVILWHMFSYLFLFLCQHAQSLSAPVCCGIVEPMNLQDSRSSLLSFSLMTVRFFAWRSVVWSSLAISQNGHLPCLWHFIIRCCQLERNRLADAYIEKNILKLKPLSWICCILYAEDIILLLSCLTLPLPHNL